MVPLEIDSAMQAPGAICRIDSQVTDEGGDFYMVGTRRSPEVTLKDAIATCEPHLALVAGSDDVSYSGVGFHESGGVDGDWSGRIVLCPGITDGEELRLAAARSGAAAIVLREAAELRASSTPAVLRLSSHGDWAEIAAALRAIADPEGQSYVAAAPVGDLFAAANALAARAGGAVGFVDPTGRVLGYSTLSDQPLDPERKRITLSLREDRDPSEDVQQIAVVNASRALIFPPEGESFGRVARAVRGGGELLGTVWVVLPSEAAGPRIAELLDTVEPVLAQHFRRARNEAEKIDDRRRDVMAGLLDPSTAAVTSARQGYPPRVDIVVERFAIDFATAPDESRSRALRRLLNVVLSSASTWFAHSRTSIVDDGVTSVVAESDAARIRAHAEFVSSADPSVRAGIGGAATTPAGIARSAREAELALGYLLTAPADGAVARFDDIRDRVALAQVGTFLADLPLAVADHAERLSDFDLRHATELTLTTFEYLQAGQSIAAASAKLHLHQNTVRNRLTRVREELGIDLDDPDTRLWLWLRLATRERVSEGSRPRALHAQDGRP